MKATEAPKKKKDPILLQSFGIQDNSQSGNSSRVRQKPRVNDINSPPQSSDCESNLKLICSTSRKKLQSQERSIQSHYENMEKILFSQNLNLKQQNAFLTSQMRKKIKHEQKYKEERKKVTIQLAHHEQQIKAIKEELFNSSSFVQNQLYYLARGLQSQNIQEIKNIIIRTIDTISAHFQLEFEKIMPKNCFENISIDQPFEQQSSKNDVEYQIEQLSKKLQKLLEEDHSANKGPLVRRQCIEISKQIKQLKDKSRAKSSLSVMNQSAPPNSYYIPRSSLQSSKSVNKDNMKRAIWQSELIKEQSEEIARFQPQIYSKVTRRKSLNRQLSPGSRADSPMFYQTAQQKRFK